MVAYVPLNATENVAAGLRWVLLFSLSLNCIICVAYFGTLSCQVQVDAF
jgi:hypothetical protein